MPKPILVLGVGIGWAATTPLYYTLVSIPKRSMEF